MSFFAGCDSGRERVLDHGQGDPPERACLHMLLRYPLFHNTRISDSTLFHIPESGTRKRVSGTRSPSARARSFAVDFAPVRVPVQQPVVLQHSMIWRMAWWHTPLSSSMISSGTGNGVVAYTTPCTEFGGECYRAVGRGVPPDRGVPHRQRLHHQERQGRHGDVLGGDATPFMALKERASTHLWRRCNHSLPFDGAQTQSMHPFMASMHPFTLAASASYKYGKVHACAPHTHIRHTPCFRAHAPYSQRPRIHSGQFHLRFRRRRAVSWRSTIHLWRQCLRIWGG